MSDIEMAGETTVPSAADPFEMVEQEELLLIEFGGQSFLIPVKEVAEVIRPVPLTPVPMAPDHLLGMANVRGQIVCVIDPSLLMNLSSGVAAGVGPMTRFLLLRHRRMHVGMWVDAVRALYRVNSRDIPAGMSDASGGFVRGELSIEGRQLRMLSASAFLN